MSIWNDLLAFGQGLLNYWLLIFGAIVMGGIDWWERHKEKSFPKRWLRPTALLCLFAACFMTWRDEHEKAGEFYGDHPHFSQRDSGLLLLHFDDGTTRYKVALKFLNVGKHGAKNLVGNILCMTQTLAGPPGIKNTIDDVNEVSSGDPLMLAPDVNPLSTDVVPQFIFCQMKYEDVETEKMYHQIWYLSWSGASKGQFITNFDNASEKDKTRITDYIKGQGISIFTD